MDTIRIPWSTREAMEADTESAQAAYRDAWWAAQDAYGTGISDTFLGVAPGALDGATTLLQDVADLDAIWTDGAHYTEYGLQITGAVLDAVDAWLRSLDA